MKKISLILCAFIFLLSGFFLASCEKSARLDCASISEITAASSHGYAIKVCFYQDERLKGKGVDIQVKCDKIASLLCWQENQERLTIEFDDYDEWYSLTSLIYHSQDRAGQENFDEFEKAVTKFYLFNSDKDLSLTFRVVAGDLEDNSDSQGQVLVGSEVISKQFTLKVKADK